MMGILGIIMIRKAKAVSGLEPSRIRLKPIFLSSNLNRVFLLKCHDGLSFLSLPGLGEIRLCFTPRFLYKAGTSENKSAPCGTLGTNWKLDGRTETHRKAPRLSGRTHGRPDRRSVEDCAAVV